jgi:hypothetical protein
MMTLRDRLSAVAVGHPSADGRRLAAELQVAVHNSVTSAQWVTNDLLRKNELSYLDNAKADHAKAREIHQQAASELRVG